MSWKLFHILASKKSLNSFKISRSESLIILIILRRKLKTNLVKDLKLEQFLV